MIVLKSALLPKCEPGLCFFLTFKELIQQCCHLHLDAHEVFFYSKSLQFLYSCEPVQDIQSKYTFYNYKKAVHELSVELGFQYSLLEGQPDKPPSDELLLQALSRRQPVLLTINASVLPHNRERKTLLKDDFHCIRPYAYQNQRLFYRDDYVPNLTSGYSVVDESEIYAKLMPYFLNYIVLTHQHKGAYATPLKESIMQCLTSFMNSSTTTYNFSGIDAIRGLASDIPLVLLEDSNLREKNLFGLLYLIKYQLYPSYYYIVESLISNIDINIARSWPILHTNQKWEELFTQLDILMFMQTQPQVNRVNSLLLEISDCVEVIVNRYMQALLG